MTTKYQNILKCKILSNQEIFDCIKRVQNVLQKIYSMPYKQKINRISLKDNQILKVRQFILHLKYVIKI